LSLRSFVETEGIKTIFVIKQYETTFACGINSNSFENVYILALHAQLSSAVCMHAIQYAIGKNFHPGKSSNDVP
jgi:hypothetical protein